MEAAAASILLLSGEQQFILDVIIVLGVEIFAGDQADVLISGFVHKDIEEGGDFAVVVTDRLRIVCGVGGIDLQFFGELVVIRDGLSERTLKIAQATLGVFEDLL